MLASKSHSATTNAKQGRVDDSFSKQISYQKGSRAIETNAKLVSMLAKDNLPFRTVEKEGFLEFIKALNLFYKPPSRKSITKLVEEKYEYLGGLTKEELSKVDALSLTTDICTDTLNNKSYLGFTAHYILNNEIKSVTIGVKELDQKHTSENIQKWIIEILENWAIATLLDPRFKKIHFNDRLACSKAIDKISRLFREMTTTENNSSLQEKSDKVSDLKEESFWDLHRELVQKNNSIREYRNEEELLACSKAIDKISRFLREMTTTENNSSLQEKSDKVSDLKEESFWDLHHELVQKNNSIRESRNEEELYDELKYYLNQPTIGMNESSIEYWNRNSTSLSTLAKRYMVIMVTSVPSERLFSKAGRIMTQDRSSLSPKHLQHLLFLASLRKKDWHL
ncbi:hypothetical protein TSAR_015047 [Trichomalopsis sarcophagae]|uniref:HAT C-terminal dimerisation domain-containing protein n=2 Tax=Trichomalopsis sarcophagae TaxID=543379 RepID=A0A232F9U9_9HYME|nr:hypothetical protein TSAR_015047 [Trichomalopsis sarcophagae]